MRNCLIVVETGRLTNANRVDSYEALHEIVSFLKIFFTRIIVKYI